MHMMYKPSNKGLKHFSSDDRIVFFEKHYLWFKEKDGNFFFDFGKYETGDVFEWKPHMNKPDSFWVQDRMIDVKTIKNSEKVDKYDHDLLVKIGILNSALV